MKKNIQINIGGSIFSIDEDAYQRLDKYLTSIKEYLINSDERDEIIKDIEMRIAELLLERQSSTQSAIELGHIEEIIEVMGQPEEYRLEEDDNIEYQTKSAKKFYRDTEDRFIAGVASGLAHYVGIDPVWMRLLWVFIVLAGVGSPIFIYILLWIIVPEARTTSEKLQMKGKSVNLSNIEKSLKEEYANVTKKVKDADIKGMKNSFKKGSARFFDWLLRVGKRLIRIVVFTLGIFLLITSFSTIIVFTVMFFIPNSHFLYSSINLGSNVYLFNGANISSIHFWILKLASHLSLIIPFIFLFILSLVAINPKMKPVGRVTKTSLLIVWVVSIVTISYYVISANYSTKYTGKTLEHIDLNLSAKDTLIFKTNLHPSLSNIHTNTNFLIQNDSLGVQYIYGSNFNIIIKPTDNDYASLKVEKSAKGSSVNQANTIANNISYTYQIDKNVLTLDNYYLIYNTIQNNNSRIRVYLELPKGMLFKMDKESANKSFKQNRNDRIISEKYLQINDNIIECISCEKEPDKKTTTDTKDKLNEENSKQVSPSSDWENRVEEAFKTK